MERKPRAAANKAWHTKKSERILLAAGLFLAGAVIAAFCLLWFLNTDPNPAGPDKLTYDENVMIGTLVKTPEERKEELQQIVDEGMVNFKINATPYFKNGKSKGELLIENPENSSNRFTVQIVRNDNGEEIYRSGAISPGQYIETAALKKELPKGQYPCTAYFTTYRLDDNSEIGRAGAEITVYVDDKE